jgi:uncharacterized protein
MRLLSGGWTDRRRLWLGAALLALLVGGALLMRATRPAAAGAMIFSTAESAEERQAKRVSRAPELWWEAMGELDYETGAMPDSLRALDGQIVRIPGFMVPLDDYATRVKEFLLVPYPGACVHVPAPPPNFIVYSQMEGGRSTRVTWWDPIWIEGRLSIQATESVYGPVGYQMEVLHIEPYVEEEDY